MVVRRRRLTSALVSPAILPFAACSSRCHRRRLACTRSVLYLSVFLRLFSPVCTDKTSRSSFVVVVVVQFPPRQPPPPLLSSSSFSRRGAHPPKLLLLLVLARRKRRRREKFSPLDASYSSVGVCSFFDERFSSILLLPPPPQKKRRMSKRSFLGGTTLSSSSLIISAAASAASVHPPYQNLLSSLLTKTQQNHHHHFCRRSWYSSESNKEELEKEIGYYTGKKRNPLTDTRLHQYDQRPPPNALCEICSRRFCSCEENRTMKRKPEMPGPEDCCQSSPQCKFCVWTIYDEQLAEYETNKELYMDKLK